MMARQKALVPAALLCALACFASPRLTPQEKRGKRLYLLTVSPSGREIPAFLGDGTEVPGSTLPCVNCHGYDGRGRPEGGVTPTNVIWEALTKPYGLVAPTGRKSPAYTEAAMARAIAMGLDPGGNKLEPVMPRYSLGREDMADLVAYMKRLGKEEDPGLGETAIRVGTILPAKGPLAEASQRVRAVLTAYFERLNAQGGIYNRRVELVVADGGATAAEAKAALAGILGEQGVFALVGGFIGGAEQEIVELAQQEEVPLIAPLTFAPRERAVVDRHVFYLLAGPGPQARALVKFAAEKLRWEKQRVAVVGAEGDTHRAVAAAVEQQCGKPACAEVIRTGYAAGTLKAAEVAADLKRRGAGAVFFFGPDAEAGALLAAAGQAGWAPQVFLSGPMAGKQIFDTPAAFREKLFLAYPTLPSDLTPAGIQDYRVLAEAHKLPPRPLPAELWTFCGAKILAEGLRRAGRELSREKLVVALEGLYEFETGLSPNVTYGPNRRIGALGAHVAAVDLDKKQFAPVSGWMALQ